MGEAYLDYAMSTIVSRAIPDVRDGLKPVQRRILYAMQDLGARATSQYRKCARIVGETMGKYHPHGDSAIYDALARMAQPFSLRYMLVDGQGNFGSVDGDPPAAMRYTEARLSRLAEIMLADIDRDTVDFVDNFDATAEMPEVLPARLPNLLVNGATGIAVGMATNMPPHNLREVADAVIRLIDEPDLSFDDLTKIVTGPDFPTHGIIGADGVREAYSSGRGRVIVRGRVGQEEDDDGRIRLIISELPYQVNKSTLVEKIADLVRGKTIEGVSNLRDESDRDGMRVVIELKRDAHPLQVQNLLFKHTSLQTTFGVNMVCLVGGQPRTLGLRDILTEFIRHRETVITRRASFDLNRATEREHLLLGFLTALDNIDEPLSFINAVLQGKFKAAFRAVDRFMINSTFGVAGLFDHATEMGLHKQEEDFGQTLAAWGVGSGPYIMLPLLGPSTLRDTVGFGVDSVTDPWPKFQKHVAGLNGTERIGVTAGEAIDLRSRLIDTADPLLATALDEYATVRAAYLQQRLSDIYDGDPPEDDFTPTFDDEPLPSAAAEPVDTPLPATEDAPASTSDTDEPKAEAVAP